MDILDQPSQQEQSSRSINDVLRDGYNFDISNALNRVFALFKETWAMCLGHVAVTGAIYYFGSMIIMAIILVGGVFSNIEGFDNDPDPRLIIESMLWIYPAIFGFFILIVWPIRAGHFIYFHNRYAKNKGNFGDFFGVFSRKYHKVIAVAFIIFILISVWVMVPAFLFVNEFVDSIMLSFESGYGEPVMPDMGMMMWMFLGYIPYIFFIVACSLATPLILFQTDDVLLAVKASIQIILKKWFAFFGFFLLLFLLSLCGILACGIGLLITNYFLPWGTYAIYEEIFVNQNKQPAATNLSIVH